MKLNKELLIISEAIRTEGYISMKRKLMQGIVVSNKDIGILNKIQSTYHKFYPNRKTSKILIIILYLSNKTNIKKIINKQNKQELKFHVDKNKRLIAIQSIKNFNINFNYIIITKNKNYNLRIDLSKENIITTNSKIPSTSYATLQIYNTSFIRNLQKTFQIPFNIGSRKSYEIDFPFEIGKLTKEQIKTILNIVISCEGCIFYKKGDRVIKIKLASKKYLEKLQQMFEKLEIKPQGIKPTKDNLFVLDIRKRKNFEKLYKVITLISKKKQNILNTIVGSYSNKRFTHYHAFYEYLLLLSKNKEITCKEASRIVNRNKDVIRRTFERFIIKSYATKYKKKVGRMGRPSSIYKITNKGLDYIKNQR